MGQSRYFRQLFIETTMTTGGSLVIKLSSIDAAWEKKLNSYPKSSNYCVQVGTSIFTLEEEEGQRVYKAWIDYLNN